MGMHRDIQRTVSKNYPPVPRERLSHLLHAVHVLDTLLHADMLFVHMHVPRGIRLLCPDKQTAPAIATVRRTAATDTWCQEVHTE